eukprot:maker-scaffold202_size261857-snap-gene-1.20 protein:Tk10173 transcript:maker-scaffold202_size261857-snap-gene-1.20-mRNA-1 annotation:"va5_rhybr ame: full"
MGEGIAWNGQAYRSNSKWDDELARIAQIWADQCASVIYFHGSDMYPKVFHERGTERTTEAFRGPPGVGQNIAWALTKDVNFTQIIDDLWYRDISQVQPGHIEDFQQVGCGWTQFPVTDSSPIRMMNSGLLAKYGMGGENKTLFENFFVCNYGVGGNVLGESVFNCDDGSSPSSPAKSAEQASLDAMKDLSSTVIKYQDQYQNASPEIKDAIQTCLEAISCIDQSALRTSNGCLSVQSKCLDSSVDRLPQQSDDDLISRLECHIGELLCGLAKTFEQCKKDHASCMDSRATGPVAATTTQAPSRGNVKQSATTRPITRVTTNGPTIGSTHLDLSSTTTTLTSIGLEITTISPFEQSGLRPNGKNQGGITPEPFVPIVSPDQITPPSETEAPIRPAPSEDKLNTLTSEDTFTPPTETEPTDVDPAPSTTPTSFKDFTPPAETEPSPNMSSTDPSVPGGSKFDEAANRPQLYPRIDMRFYNASERSEERLAICLNSLECTEDVPQCQQLLLICNQGLNVTQIHKKVLEKLTECMIQDIICFLQGGASNYEFCRTRFESCVDIILPNNVRIPLYDPSLQEESDFDLTNLEAFVEISGLTNHSEGSDGSIAGNVTHNVFDSISNTLGGIQVSDAIGNKTLDEILADSSTLKVFQDIHIILNDNPEESNGTFVALTVNGTKIMVDIDNPAVVLDPNSFIEGFDKQANLDNSTKKMLIEEIINNFKAVGTVCAFCSHPSLEEDELLVVDTNDTNSDTRNNENKHQHEKDTTKIAGSLANILLDDQVELSAPITLTSDPKNNLIKAEVQNKKTDILSPMPLQPAPTVTFTKAEIPTDPQGASDFVKDKIKPFLAPASPAATTAQEKADQESEKEATKIAGSLANILLDDQPAPTVTFTKAEIPTDPQGASDFVKDKIKPFLAPASPAAITAQEKADQESEKEATKIAGSLANILLDDQVELSAPITLTSDPENNLIKAKVQNKETDILSPVPLQPAPTVTFTKAEIPTDPQGASDFVKDKIKPFFLHGSLAFLSFPQFGYTISSIPSSSSEMSTAVSPISNYPEFGFTLEPNVPPRTPNSSISTTVTEPTKTPPSYPISTSQSIVSRIRDIVLGLVATTVTGLMSQTMSIPGSPARKEDVKTTEAPFNPFLLSQFPLRETNLNQIQYYDDNDPLDPFGVLDINPQLEFGTLTDVKKSPTIKFGLDDAITSESPYAKRTTTTLEPLTEVSVNESEISEILDILLNEKGIEYINTVPDEDDQTFDNNLNILFSRESSADIVNATVVEDFDYARRIRDSKRNLGIATIWSIIVGAISLLLIGLFIFMIIARRRRRSYSTTTPTVSRNTLTGTPIIVDTPSPSVSSVFNSGLHSAENGDPVMPIDGHQTIVTSYEEYMFAGGARGSIMSSLPPPADSGPTSLESNPDVPLTQDLSDRDDYLFSRTRP